MAESLRHLDLLLQLQAESFQEMLEQHVSIHYDFTNCLILWFSFLFKTILPGRVQVFTNFTVVFLGLALR